MENIKNIEANSNSTHFGFKTVDSNDKEGLVKQVFSSVAQNYDIMNDAMSLGVHRIWKQLFAKQINARAGEKILDIAGGTGDIARLLYLNSGRKADILLTDINADMLAAGKKRLLDEGIIMPTMVCDAQNLPFENNHFHKITAAFGVRNMTDKLAALKSMRRCLKAGGALFVLEFSKPAACLQSVYDFYSFKVIPQLGEWLAKDRESYQYLVESIKVHPDQEDFATLFKQAGFEDVRYINLSLGIAAIHIGYKY